MLLDSFSEIFVWVGKSSSENAKQLALDYAARYIAMNSFEGVSVVVVPSGAEPALFTNHFKSWDANFSRNFVSPYQSKADLQAAAIKKAAEGPKRLRANTEDLVPYEELKNKFHENIPPDRKEEYIDDETFERLFAMSREEFYKLARWRRDAKKKTVGLF